MNNMHNCPVEATLELIGGKYKALILWYLAKEKLRYSQLRDLIGSITPKMLTQQLRELETNELIHREEHFTRTTVYWGGPDGLDPNRKTVLPVYPNACSTGSSPAEIGYAVISRF